MQRRITHNTTPCLAPGVVLKCKASEFAASLFECEKGVQINAAPVHYSRRANCMYGAVEPQQQQQSTSHANKRVLDENSRLSPTRSQEIRRDAFSGVASPEHTPRGTG